MTVEEIRLIIQLAVQVPLVAAFIIFAILQNRSFLKHIDDIDRRRTESAVQREKERAEQQRQDAEEVRKYLAESRNAFLSGLSSISKDAAETNKQAFLTLSQNTAAVQELTASMIRHDASQGEVLRSVAATMQNIAKATR